MRVRFEKRTVPFFTFAQDLLGSAAFRDLGLQFLRALGDFPVVGLFVLKPSEIGAVRAKYDVDDGNNQRVNGPPAHVIAEREGPSESSAQHVIWK